MGAAKAVRPLTLEEYLALEREAPVKHELVEGFPHAVAGAGDRHNPSATTGGGEGWAYREAEEGHPAPLCLESYLDLSEAYYGF